MKKALLSLVFVVFGMSFAVAQKQPCSGKAGGVKECASNGKFVCNDGRISQSKKICESSTTNQLAVVPEKIIICKAVGITDGDTLTCLKKDKTTIKVRLSQIDTPERGQPYFKRAKKALSDLIFGKEVKLTNLSKDRYGRTVAKVWLADLDVCLELVKMSMARVYKRYQYDKHYSDAELEAQNKKLGIWG